MGATSLASVDGGRQRRCTGRRPRRLVTFDFDCDDPRSVGLRIAGPRLTDDRAVAEVAWVVEDWHFYFGERKVALSTVIKGLAGDLLCRDLKMLGYVCMPEDHYRTAAWWRLRYVLHHLEYSGLELVRMSR